MIITEQKPSSEILQSLKGYKKIFLIGCGECAAECRTGGEAELEEMKLELEKQDKVILGYALPSAPCIAAQIKTTMAKSIKSLKEAEAILVLACGLGVQSVKDNDRLGHTVLPACNTLFGAVKDSRGNFYEKCSLCGDCLLGITAGICPITLCPKSLLNGPCGGMNKGKCETDPDKDCAWVLIYNELEKKGRLAEFKKIQQPKDFKKRMRPGKKILNR
jgi:ferredoxin